MFNIQYAIDFTLLALYLPKLVYLNVLFILSLTCTACVDTKKLIEAGSSLLKLDLCDDEWSTEQNAVHFVEISELKKGKETLFSSTMLTLSDVIASA